MCGSEITFLFTYKQSDRRFVSKCEKIKPYFASDLYNSEEHNPAVRHRDVIRRVRWGKSRWDPLGLSIAAAGQPSRHPLLSALVKSSHSLWESEGQLEERNVFLPQLLYKERDSTLERKANIKNATVNWKKKKQKKTQPWRSRTLRQTR